MAYRERLAAPLWWWVLGLGLFVPTAAAIGFMLGPWVSLGAALTVAVLVAFALSSFSATEIVVDAAGVRVGRSMLEWDYVGRVEVLDAAAADHLLGARADARAHVVQRPWLREGVRISVEDSADPHPYWLVSSRTPARCAAAIVRARAEGGQG
ncbi:DUF3093 domain-containing protein [Propioniciclava sp.]|uniref:DUF3093 domain-containing protein n=1 Tax=Propioniciclava sp. TaxID=2038686 RepID=UPI0026212A01|nr:DUF3093 domain-containing protein [Propioniciclava sp.]